MKEYICKEDIKKIVCCGRVQEVALYELPTLTRADICREFADKIFERFGQGKSLHDVIVDVLLAEMEQGK